MPEPKSTFDATYPCDFYEPAELFESDQMYTIPEIARLLQELDPDAEIDPDTEAVLIDWAIPWVMTHAEDLVIAEPLAEDGPGYYGVAPHAIDGEKGSRRRGHRPARRSVSPDRPDALVILVAGGARVDAGKTTFSTGLVADLAARAGDAVGVKPRAGNDYWYDHDDYRIASDSGRLYGKTRDASRPRARDRWRALGSGAVPRRSLRSR